MEKTVRAEGKTTTEAIEKGLKELGVSKDKVEIKVLEEKKRSFYSILSPRVVKVELTLKEDKKEKNKEEKKHNENIQEIEKAEQDIKEFLETNIVKPEDITNDDIRKFIKDIKVFDDVIVIETATGNTYNIDPDKVKLKYAPRNKEYLQSLKRK